MFLLAIAKLESKVNHEKKLHTYAKRLHKENVLVDTLDCGVEF